MHKLVGKPDHVFSLKTLHGVWNNIACSQKDLDKPGITTEMVLEKQTTHTAPTWRCPLTTTGDYKVNVLRKKLDKCSPIDIGKFEWVKEV